MLDKNNNLSKKQSHPSVFSCNNFKHKRLLNGGLDIKLDFHSPGSVHTTVYFNVVHKKKDGKRTKMF